MLRRFFVRVRTPLPCSMHRAAGLPPIEAGVDNIHLSFNIRICSRSIGIDIETELSGAIEVWVEKLCDL